MIKKCFQNFFKRFKYFFICFGLILVGFVGGAAIFYGGLRITMLYLDQDLIIELNQYFKDIVKTIRPSDIISLSIISKIYKDFISMADSDTFIIQFGLTLSAILAVLAVYGSYKGSIAIVNYITKRQFRNKNTKHGFVPFIIKLSIGIAFSLALMLLLHLWTWSFIFVLFFYILIDSFEEVVSIRYVYFNHIKLKDFIFSKSFFNTMSLYLIYQYGILIIASAAWFVTPFISLLIMVPILGYNEANIEYTIIDNYKDMFSE